MSEHELTARERRDLCRTQEDHLNHVFGEKSAPAEKLEAKSPLDNETLSKADKDAIREALALSM